MAAVESVIDGDVEAPGARWAARLVFLTIGLTAGTWGALVPFIKTGLGLTHGDLGLIMLMGGVGAVSAMPIGGAMAARLGSRATIAVGGVLSALGVPALALAPTPVTLAVALFSISMTMGLMDVGCNAQGVMIERVTRRPALSSFHGFFSLGGLAAPLLLGMMMEVGASPGDCALLVAAVMLVIFATQVRRLLGTEFEERREGSEKRFALPSGVVWLFGLFALIFYMVEGTMFDWTALFLREYRAFDPAWAGLGLAGFSLTMTGVRLFGDGLVGRFGPVRMVAGGGLLGAFGILLAVSVPSAWVGILGFALFGLGAGNVVPVVFSATGRLPGISPALSIAATATLGNCGILIGPATVGFVSDAFGLPIALAGGAALVALVALCARTVRPAGG